MHAVDASSEISHAAAAAAIDAYDATLFQSLCRA